jgi:hypothetical protein
VPLLLVLIWDMRLEITFSGAVHATIAHHAIKQLKHELIN